MIIAPDIQKLSRYFRTTLFNFDDFATTSSEKVDDKLIERIRTLQCKVVFIECPLTEG
jgi:hypothetical protein